MKLRGNWSYPTPVKFGAGRIAELAALVTSTGMKTPLLVTDKALASLPITARALDLLAAGGLGRAVFSEVDPNPNEANMQAGLKVYRAGGHDHSLADWVTLLDFCDTVFRGKARASVFDAIPYPDMAPAFDWSQQRAVTAGSGA